MSVIYEHLNGCFVLDPLKFEHYFQAEPGETISGRSYVVKPCLYNVESVFKMNSQHEADVRKVAEGQSLLNSKRRKRKSPDSPAVNSLDERIEKMLNSVMLSAKAAGLFNHSSTSHDNNMAARELVNALGCGDLLSQLTAFPCHGQRLLPRVVLGSMADAANFKDSLFHSIIQSDCEDMITLNLQGRRFLIPPKSTFLMSDLDGLISYSQSSSETFDFLIMDPPWVNKSIKRKRVYNTLSNDKLLQLPVDTLSSAHSLLALWCTNNRSQQEFVTNKLLPQWGYRVTAMWYWCKVTRSGETICSFNTNGKKPYETLLIACRVDRPQPQSLPDCRLLVSVPSLLHSSKPPLLDVFKDYLPSRPRCLELFARNLLPNVTSWGNEVLLHQDTEYFQLIPSQLKSD